MRNNTVAIVIPCYNGWQLQRKLKVICINNIIKTDQILNLLQCLGKNYGTGNSCNNNVSIRFFDN